MAHDVFISYSSKDKEIADLICSALEQSGLACWIAPRNVQPGKKYGKEIVLAIQESTVILLIFSESSNKSEHVENEIDIAFNEGKTIIPFKITDTIMSPEFKYYLNKKHWIDGVPEPEKYFEKLVKQISLSVPRLSEEKKEEELFHGLDMLLNEYKKKGRNISKNKLIYFRTRIEEFLEEEKSGEDQEFQKMLDDFISNELVNKDFTTTSDEAQTNEDKTNETDDENEGHYDILKNGAGELLIIIKARPGEPEDPRFIYDGGSCALLYRSRNSSVMLGNINMEARPAIRAVDEVLMIEVKNDEVCREYTVPTRNVRSLDALLDIAKSKIENRDSNTTDSSSEEK